MRRRELDELTDREREVLELLRRDFTNEQIAQRLGVTLDGAKYHVSQILSKLGVATREEAAAVALGERRRWWAHWPLWARIAGAATVVAAVAGITLLAWGVLRTEGGDAETSVATESAEATAVVQSGMDRYANEVFRVEFDYPGTWVPDPGYGAGSYKDQRGREFGFFTVDACCDRSLTLDDVAKAGAEHKLRPYGEQPMILNLALPDGEARLILPDESTTDADEAELIIRYPPSPGTISDSYAFFILYAHQAFIRDIAPTLRITGSSTTSTP